MSRPATSAPSWMGLIWAALPVLGVLAALALSRLGRVRDLAVAATRMVVQLALLGVVLRAIFAAQNPAIVGIVSLAMLAAAAHSVAARTMPARAAWGLRAEAFVTIAVGATASLVIATRLAMRVQPWYDAATLVPLLGMILGNSINGVALAAERLEGELRADRDRVELRLALGATARQAAAPALRAAVAAGLTPVINSMTVAGIVAVPGMMTGQILAGADVGDALRYQILIYLLMSTTVGLSLLGLLALRLRHYFTPACQLRPEALDPDPPARR